MRFVSILAFALAAQAGVAVAATPGGAPFDAVFARFTPTTPGCAIGVRRGDEPPVLRGYGSADLEHDVAITPQTVFEAGSVSKQFTAAAVLLLVQDGKVSLSDDIRKYFPEMPDYGQPVTIDNLLSHTSGLRDWGEVEEIGGWPRGDRAYTMRDVLHVASRQTALNYRPGTAWSYTNTGYNLAAMLVERVSGQSFQDYTRDHMFAPLGMYHTQWRDDFRHVVPGRAVAYSPAPGGFLQNMPFESAYGNGGLLTTVGDLLIWNRALTEQMLGPKVTAELQEQAKLTDGRDTGYARGLFIGRYHGLSEISHGGATAGYRAWLGRYPDQKISVALLCNAADANSGQLAHAVADRYLPAAPAPAHAAAASRPLSSLAGWYVDDRWGDPLHLVAAGDGLKADGAGEVKLDGDGQPTLMGMKLVVQPDGGLRLGDMAAYRRAEAYAPTRAELEQVAGRYRSAEAEADFVVTLDKDALRLTVAERPDASFLLAPAYRGAFTYDGGVLRPVRDASGRITALRVSGSRVWDLRLDRVG